jgi:hydroxylaminobenzene mutase
MDNSKRLVVCHGVFLFLLGLLTGLVREHFTNVRMSLAAHLEGVMNGIRLIALGGIWQEVRLSATSTKATFWLLLYGAYSNWLVTTITAILGTSSMTPIAAAGRSASQWNEALISIGFVSVPYRSSPRA